MPELPEVETIARGLSRRLLGRVLEEIEPRRADLRAPIPLDLKARLRGERIRHIGRRAKYLLIETENDQVLIAHLGMSGRMIFDDPAAPRPLQPHDHVIFTFDDGTRLRFNDARRFGRLDLTTAPELARHPLLAFLGPEPLGNEFNGESLARVLAARSGPLKTVLLDQRVVAGLGNIYVCESLYRAGLSPLRAASTVSGAGAERLARAIRAVLESAIAAGGSSLRDYV
ncbi:MAG TPA: bifunctional DNA-formamidopyrimidine glycosylase/DNA-(apurinic or apyrimidinic site) lyase, partial [Stellaceae bacterium]|nr:bifunctional DNA-formamidopyrimidine glycosylase/DNA-(apurinic or apyrimidinic site) lyase [Stellaceae bacterium]